jgi:catechol 2,3-dioxygenase-like lactoylglutathione lyase family enzyme
MGRSLLQRQKDGDVVDVQFITSVAVITPDPSVSRRLYVDALGLPLTAEDDGYLHSERIDGSNSFGVWPLPQAAQACFGTPDWPVDRPMPQASIEFEVSNAATVQVAAEELTQKGFTLLHEARTEPWGQTVARLQSSEGCDHRPVLRALDAYLAEGPAPAARRPDMPPSALG